jgi:hypothetical protein
VAEGQIFLSLLGFSINAALILSTVTGAIKSWLTTASLYLIRSVSGGVGALFHTAVFSVNPFYHPTLTLLFCGRLLGQSETILPSAFSTH